LKLRTFHAGFILVFFTSYLLVLRSYWDFERMHAASVLGRRLGRHLAKATANRIMIEFSPPAGVVSTGGRCPVGPEKSVCRRCRSGPN
jgi:hypothetical protein